MKRTVRIADIVAAVGGIVLLVSSFLNHFGQGSTFSAWHQVLINQLVVTDLLGFVVGAVTIVAAFGVLPERIQPWIAPVAVVVLLNAIFSAIAFSQLAEYLASELHVKSPGIGIGFYLGIVGAALLAIGAVLAWLPVLNMSLGGAAPQDAVDAGYQGPTMFPGAPGQPASPEFGGPAQPGFGAPAGSGAFGATPPPSRSQEPTNPWAPGAQATPSPWNDPRPAPSSPTAEPTPAGAGDQSRATNEPSPPAPQPAASEPLATPQPAPVPDPGAWQQAAPAQPQPAQPQPQPAQAQPSPQAQPAWGEQRPAPAPAAVFSPFWAAVPTSRTVYNPDQSGSPVGYVQPGTWYTVVAQHASGGLVVQLPTGGHGVLVETDDLIRG